jgi:8-oxo-dGTP pyrophosphatase MutT (NUDIX family)
MALAWSGVERDENLEQALRRELLEESGIELTRKPCLHGIFSNFERSAGDHIAVYVFRDWTRVCAFSPDLKLSKTSSLSWNHYQMD